MQPNQPLAQSTVDPRHEQSQRDYPKLNLSEREYVILHIGRHPVGKFGMWIALGLLALIVFGGLVFYAVDYHNLTATTTLPSVGIVAIPAVLLLAIFAGIAWVSNTVYNGNQIFLTNESIIQHVQTSLFSTQHEQLNLVKIEDVTVIQNGILPKMLNYGTVEVNTMDSNDAHVLTMVRNPQAAADAIHNAAEQAISRTNVQSQSAATGPAIA